MSLVSSLTSAVKAVVAAVSTAIVLAVINPVALADERPNVVIIFADDLGYCLSDQKTLCAHHNAPLMQDCIRRSSQY